MLILEAVHSENKQNSHFSKSFSIHYFVGLIHNFGVCQFGCTEYQKANSALQN